MPTTSAPRICLAAATPERLEEVRPLLDPVGAVDARPAAEAADDDPAGYALLVLDAPAEQAGPLLRGWRGRLGEFWVPVLWLTDDRAGHASALAAGADVCLARPFAPGELTAQAQALVRRQQAFARAAGRAAEAAAINQRLNQLYQQMDADLELARNIHKGFLPPALPDVQRARFAVAHRPRSRVGGDSYDVCRLDEEHVGFYVADAMAYGMPASSLLTIFLKKSVQPKEVVGRAYRLVPPDEVLGKVNRELLGLGLPETPVVTMLYAHLNCRDGELSFARAAHPAPLYVPAGGEPELWPSTGPLLGAFDAAFAVQTRQLNPGDKVLLYTDGFRPAGEVAGAAEDLLAAAGRHRDLPLAALVDSVTRDLLEQTRQPDDLTVLGVEMRPG
jgi:serine phosphatase RsbU (regulator of sigma subunit)